MNFYDYLELHGISEESALKFDLHADSNRLVIPIKDSEGTILYNKYRNLDYNKDTPDSAKYTFDKDSHPTLFNIGAVKDSSYVVVTEGEIDAIRLDQEGICAVSGTAGVTTFKPEWASLLIGKNIFICFDSDEPGKAGAIKVATQVLPTARIISLPDATKDISEYFLSGRNKTDFFELVKAAKMAPLIPVITGKELLETEFPPENYIIDKILGEQSLTLWVGEAGSFKSYMALYLAKQLITKEPFLGHWEVKRTAKILFIDKENKLRRTKQRAEALGLPKTDNIFFLQYPEQFMLEKEMFIAQISAFISQQKIDVVILDSFIDMFEGNENSSTDTAKAFNSIRSISSTVSFILLHHDSKPIPKMVRTAGQKTRGSSNIIAQVDTQFYLEKGKDGVSFTIEQGKSRDDEPVKKFEVGLVSEEGKIVDFIYKGEVQDELSKVEESKKLIYDFVVQHPSCTRDDINAELLNSSLSPRTGKNALLSLIKEGLLDSSTKPGHGRKNFYFAVGDSESPAIEEE